MGFTGKAYEKSPEKKGSYLAEGDVERKENQMEIWKDISSGEVYSCHLSPTCTYWITMQNMNHKTTRTHDRPEGDGTLECEEMANREMAVALWIVLLCIAYGVFFSLEHPVTSRLWRLPLVLFLLEVVGIFVFEVDLCAFGKRPDDWNPTHGDVRVKKSLRIMTNNPYLRNINRRCVDVEGHTHEPTIGNSSLGKSRSLHSSEYPVGFGRTYAAMLRTAWAIGVNPVRKEVPGMNLEELKKSIARDPREFPLVNAMAAPGEEERVGAVGIQPEVEGSMPEDSGGAASSGQHADEPEKSTRPVRRRLRPLYPAGAAASSAVLAPEPLPKDDYWLETEDHWVRIHVVPRTTYFYPADGPEGPVLHQIKPVRVTQLCYLDGTKETREHAWDDTHWGKAKTKARWIGRSVFV